MESQSWENVKARMVALHIFEVVSGFMVNFHKSPLIGINVSHVCLLEEATFLNFKKI